MSDKPVSLVTGASRGIGRAIAVALGRLGHVVIVNYHARQDAADSVVAEIHAAGGHAVSVQADVSRHGDRERLIQRTLDCGGRLDVLVNNAGITSPGRQDLLAATEESWDQVFATNLKGPFFLAQLAARQMIVDIKAGTAPNGKIINVSSISAFAMSTDRADYCMAKAGMGAMTNLLAARLAPDRITVFEICPGVIATDMTGAVKEKYDRLFAEGLAPIAHWGQPEDVARAVTAVVSDAFPYSTGQRICVDGGFHIRRL